MANSKSCHAGLVAWIVFLIAWCDVEHPTARLPHTESAAAASRVERTSEQAPELTPTIVQAKDALLGLLRSRRLLELSSVDPDRLSQRVEGSRADGTWDWGPFTVCLSARTYEYWLASPKCTRNVTGRLESQAGRWVALPPGTERGQ
jgi:hypothetical protein